jgi:hypothetical protein
MLEKLALLKIALCNGLVLIVVLAGRAAACSLKGVTGVFIDRLR